MSGNLPQGFVRRFLARLLPARERTVPTLTNEERMRLLSQVADNDAGMRAVNDILTERLEIEFNAAIDLGRTDVEKLRACEGLRTTWMLLQTLEQERGNAAEWRKAKERE